MPIYDERDVLLLAEGQVITPVFQARLFARGVNSVKVHESEMPRICAGKPLGTAKQVPPERDGYYCNLENQISTLLDQACDDEAQLEVGPQGDPLAEELVDHGAQAFDQEMLNEFVDNRESSITQVEHIFDSLCNSKHLDMDSLSHLADEAMNDMTKDADLFACLGLNPYSDKYPARHSMHLTMLAMSIATELKLDRPTVKELAIGCLIHDSGMLKINRDLYLKPEIITDIEFLEITKHPVIIFDQMKDMRLIPQRSAFIAYQMHERCNGKGYPRQREGNQIHFLSKVAAVSDTFIAMVSPRPHRPGLMPYKAMARIIMKTNEGYFDPAATRALLNRVSLFPIGSFIELNDGRQGRVLRSNGELYNQPIVEAWHPDQEGAAPEIVNLAENAELTIARALPYVERPRFQTEAVAADWD